MEGSPVLIKPKIMAKVKTDSKQSKLRFKRGSVEKSLDIKDSSVMGHYHFRQESRSQQKLLIHKSPFVLDCKRVSEMSKVKNHSKE